MSRDYKFVIEDLEYQIKNALEDISIEQVFEKENSRQNLKNALRKELLENDYLNEETDIED